MALLLHTHTLLVRRRHYYHYYCTFGNTGRTLTHHLHLLGLTPFSTLRTTTRTATDTHYALHTSGHYTLLTTTTGHSTSRLLDGLRRHVPTHGVDLTVRHYNYVGGVRLRVRRLHTLTTLRPPTHVSTHTLVRLTNQLLVLLLDTTTGTTLHNTFYDDDYYYPQLLVRTYPDTTTLHPDYDLTRLTLTTTPPYDDVL